MRNFNVWLFLLKKTETTLPYQCVSFYKKQKQGSITAFILKQRKNDQIHLLNNWIVIMANQVYEFMTAVRGYHYHKTYRNPVCHQTLYCWHEAGNLFDPFAIIVCKYHGEIVGHLPMEILRITKFLLDQGFKSTVHFFFLLFVTLTIQIIIIYYCI